MGEVGRAFGVLPHDLIALDPDLLGFDIACFLAYREDLFKRAKAAGFAFPNVEL